MRRGQKHPRARQDQNYRLMDCMNSLRCDAKVSKRFKRYRSGPRVKLMIIFFFLKKIVLLLHILFLNHFFFIITVHNGFANLDSQMRFCRE